LEWLCIIFAKKKGRICRRKADVNTGSIEEMPNASAAN
jgi:hypothetical protein